MSASFEFDLEGLRRALNASVGDVADVAKESLHDVMDEWLYEARNLAPLDKGTLRRGMYTKVKTDGDGLAGEIHANAVESSQRWPNFNYAYYIHEVRGRINNPKTPGTIAKFLDVPAQKNREKWLEHIEEAIRKKAKDNGF